MCILFIDFLKNPRCLSYKICLTKKTFRVDTRFSTDTDECCSSSPFGFSHQGSPQRIFRLQLILSSVSSSVTSTYVMSSFTTSINLLFAFPVSSFLATTYSASFSQYTHHLSPVDVHTTSILPLVFSLQTFPPVLSL